MPETFEIALLIPHYNDRSSLETTLESISFAGSLIIVLVDDGSDKDHQPYDAWLLAQQERLGFRIHFIPLEKNTGIEGALNAGLHFIQNELSVAYIARLDCGDRNEGNRLNKQVQYLKSHPNICLVGAWARIDAGKRIRYVVRKPVTHTQIKRQMHINNCFVHPAVMFRMSAIPSVGLYSHDFPAAEDYDFFFRFVERFETANLPEILVTVRMGPANISYKKRKAQLRSRFRIMVKYFRFNVHSVWGLLRTAILMTMPLRQVEQFKHIAFNDRSAHH